MKRRLPRSIAIVVLSTFVLLVPAFAQTPTAAATGTIAAMAVDRMPGPHSEVWFLRFVVQPKGTLPVSEQAGPMLVAVESGTVVLTTDTPLAVESGEGALETRAAGEMMLTAGQATLLPDRARIGLRNDGMERASLLTVVVMSGEREVEVEQSEGTAVGVTGAEPTGVSVQALAIGRGAFGDGPGRIAIERIALAAGETSTTSPGATVEAGSIEAGSVDFAVTTGLGYVWRGIADASPESQTAGPLELAAGATGMLTAGDGYFFGTATAATLSARGEPATILRAIVSETALATPAS